MSIRIETTIANEAAKHELVSALSSDTTPRCTCGEWSDSGPSVVRVLSNFHEHRAMAILAALKAARIAVVELKTEPDDAEVDAQEWATSSALCARHFEDSPGLIYVWDKAHAWDHGADPITPTQARELAAALLTAAAAVGARITVEEQP